MTAFDNIKTNNWPATSNDLEDFLVLKLPLNDQASLTESLPVVAGSQELSPKRTLTNTGVSIEQPRSVVNVKLHTYIYNTPGTLTVNGSTVPRGSDPNGDVTFIVAVNGPLSSIAWSYDSGNGPYCYMRGIEVDLGDGNGYQLIQDGSFGVAAYSSLISGTVDSTYPLSNLFGGTIGTGYTNGTRHTNPGTLTLNLSSVFPAKKHYANNAKWGASSVNYISTDALKGVPVNQPWTCEFYWKKEGTQHGNHGHFLLNPNNQSLGYREAPATGTSTNDFYCNIGGTTATGMITTTITEGVWNHFAFVHEGGGTIKTYLNGQLETTKTIGTTGTFADSTSIGGGVGSYTSQGVKGSIQDYRIYLTAKYTSNFTPPSAILG